MGKGARLGLVLALFVAAAGLVSYALVGYVIPKPPVIDFAAGHSAGTPVDLHLQVVGALGYGPHPTYVSYLTMAPNGKWVHTTRWELPANTRVNVTVDQYDSGSPLRNQFFGGVTGTLGGKATLNGKPFTMLNSNNGAGVGHTFTMPALGINVPLWGVSGSAKNACNQAAPCPTSAAHQVVKFSFMTPGGANVGHTYRWQCFVPCGLATVDGNGGPMQAIGYMGGFMTVVA